MTATAESKVMIGYPMLVQAPNHCWAYVIKSMFDYLTSTDENIYHVYGACYPSIGINDLYNRGITITQSYEVIKYMIGNSVYTSKLPAQYTPLIIYDAMSFPTIQAKVNAKLPSFIGGFLDLGDGTYIGHAVALIGYSKWTNSDNTISYGIYYMDPVAGELKHYRYDPNSNTQYFESNNRILDWSAVGSIFLIKER